MAGVKTGVYRHYAQHGPQQQAGRSDEQQRQRQLRRDKRPDDALAGASAGRAAGARHSQLQIPTAQPQRRQDARQQGREDRRGNRNTQDASVRRGVERNRFVWQRHRFRERRRGQQCNCNSHESSGSGQRRSFKSEQAHQACAPGAQSRPRGELRRSGRAARQQKISDVYRRDQQDHSYHRERKRQRLAKLASNGVEALCSGLHQDPEVIRLRRCLPGVRRWLVAWLHALVESSQLRLGLSGDDFRPQAAHHTGEESHGTAGQQLGIGEWPQGYPNVRSVAWLVAAKADGGHTHDRAQLLAHGHPTPQRGRIAEQRRRPERVAHNGGTIRHRRRVILVGEEPSESRREAEHLKIVPGNEAAAHVNGGRVLERSLKIRLIGYGEHP